MKNKKIFNLIMIVTTLVVIILFSSCSQTTDINNDKLKIVATIFPQYDFVRQIAGEQAEVMILLSPGIESHTYEPTPLDIKNINDADLFIYTGKYMEPWVQSIVESIDNKTIVVNVSTNISLINADHSHDSNHKEVHANDDHQEENHNANQKENHDTHNDYKQVKEHIHQHGPDPHIWLDPNLAQMMVDNITYALCQKDENNSEFYIQNADEYKQKLVKLDRDYQEMIDNAKVDTIAIAGRFAYAYLMNGYDIDYISAYDSCSTQDEPSVKSIIEVVDFIKENDINVVYHEELVDPIVAKSIVAQTGAELEVLHTVHNISEKRMNQGTTYLDIMYENLESLRKGLN